MNNDSTNKINRNLTSGVSSGAGTVAGVVIGATIDANTIAASEIEAPAPNNDSIIDERSSFLQTHEKESTTQNQATYDTISTPKPSTSSGEIEVIGYDRVPNGDGKTVEVALIKENGCEITFVDADLDGEADFRICDSNHNDVIEDGEVEFVHGQGISMQSFADAIGYTPQHSQNDIPDYINDANVNTYLS